MRTTLTLDEDVAALIKRLRRSRGVSLKRIVNDALRVGLERMVTPGGRKRPYHTRPVSLGRCLAGRLDNVADVLAALKS